MTAGRVMMRVASVLAWVGGVGFGLPCIYAIWYFATTGTTWYLLGMPTYGHGPFDPGGFPTAIPLLVAFLLVCAAEVVSGWLLWGYRRTGAVLTLALLPFQLLFWWGFVLPFGPPGGLACAALVLLARPAWRPSHLSIAEREPTA